MISYEAAKKKAIELQKTVNGVTEYSDAYFFYNKDYKGDGANGLVVMKKDGSTKSVPQYVLDRSTTDKGKSIKF